MSSAVMSSALLRDGLSGAWALLCACSSCLDGFSIALSPESNHAVAFYTLLHGTSALVRACRWAQARPALGVADGALATVHHLLCVADVVITSGGGAAVDEAGEAEAAMIVIQASNKLRACFEDTAAEGEEEADEEDDAGGDLSDGGWGGGGAGGGAGVMWERVEDDDS